MKVGEIYGGKFIKADTDGHLDIPGKPYDIVVTITNTDITEFKPDKPGEEPRKQITLSFAEVKDMELGLNATNARAVSTILGSDDTDDWIGGKIELCTVPEQRSATGHAVRVRKPRNGVARAPEAVTKRFGNDAANRLTARLTETGRTLQNLRAHLVEKFPQFVMTLNSDLPNWPAEVGKAVAEWFAKPEPEVSKVGMGEDDIPF